MPQSDFDGTSMPGLIDTHCHLVDLQHLRYPWLQQVPMLQHNFSFDDYCAQARISGVTGSIYMEVDVAEGTLAASLASWVAATRELLAGVSADETARLFSRNAERVYRLS